jgi:hypothetical protein
MIVVLLSFISVNCTQHDSFQVKRRSARRWVEKIRKNNSKRTRQAGEVDGHCEEVCGVTTS